MARMLLTAAAVSGALSVALGAFGAHGLRRVLSAEMMAVYQTGVQYHQMHALALLAAGVLALHAPGPAAMWAGIGFLAGTLLFSGSLYALALTEVRVLGAITPLGGLAFIAGWAALAVAAWRTTA